MKMVVKENEIQQNKNGITMKTNRANIDTWKLNITECFLSLDYKISEKHLSDGHQIVFACDEQKFTFVFFETGRITIKTNDNDKLRCVFLDKHETILGISLREIEEQETMKSFAETEETFIHPTLNKHSTPNNKKEISFSKIRVDEIFYDNIQSDILKLQEKHEALKVEVEALQSENQALRESKCPCTDTPHEVTNKADIVNEVLEKAYQLFKREFKKLSETIDRRITNTNRNINILQLENKLLRQQTHEVVSKSKQLTDDIAKLKTCVTNESNINEANRERLIEIERTLASEFAPHPAPTTEHTHTNQIHTSQADDESKDTLDTHHSQSNKTKQLELLIIGSSMVKYIDAKRVEKRKPEISETICIPGAKIQHIIAKLKDMKASYNIKKMIIHVGANHIPQENPEKLSEDIRRMFREVREMFPNTTIYNSAMIPRNANNIFPGLNKINDEAAEHCLSLNIKTIRHPQFGIDEINFRILKGDKIHPTFNGTAIMAKNMIAAYRNYKQETRRN